MRLTTKARYAVKAMLDIAIHVHESERWHVAAADVTVDVRLGAMPVADIAARQDISVSYLEQLFRHMRKAGLVQSVRGPGGGYVLARSASEISIASIMDAVDEGIHVAAKGASKNANASTIVASLWSDLTEQIQRFVEDISLQDLITRHEKLQGTNGENTLVKTDKKHNLISVHNH